jgi:hypothetical protein
MTGLPVIASPNGTNNDTTNAPEEIKYVRPNEKVVFVISLVKNGNLAYMEYLPSLRFTSPLPNLFILLCLLPCILTVIVQL